MTKRLRQAEAQTAVPMDAVDTGLDAMRWALKATQAASLGAPKEKEDNLEAARERRHLEQFLNPGKQAGWHVMKKQQRIAAAPTGRFEVAESNRRTQAPT